MPVKDIFTSMVQEKIHYFLPGHINKTSVKTNKIKYKD